MFQRSSIDDLLSEGLSTQGLTFTGTSDLDDSDVTWALTAGWKFIPYMAIEAQYLDLGAAKYTASGDVSDGISTSPADLGLTVDSSGFALSVLGILPVAEVWEFYARLGMYFGDTEGKVSVTVDDVKDSTSESKSEEEFFYGVGAGHTFNETWNVRAEYTIYQDIGDEKLTGEADVSRFVIALNYMF